MILPFVLIFGGWALAFVLSMILGPWTDYNLFALIFCLCVGSGCCIVAVEIA